MTLDQIRLPDSTISVEGSRKKHEIWVATLSTCMWCKRGKKWLKDNNYSFRYTDIDKIPVNEKKELKKQIKEVFGVKPRFPFIVVDRISWDSGYNPDIWEDMLK